MSDCDDRVADLSSSVIKQEVGRRFSGEVNVRLFDSVGSTNTWVKTHLASAPLMAGQALVCAAEHQTAGRGRRGKTWHSPDRGITFTTAFLANKPADQLSGLSLLCGAVVCDVLRTHGISDARVKWPNDILVNGAKLAGILVEVVQGRMPGDGETNTSVIIGTGVNYRRGRESGLIDQESTDLFQLAGNRLPDRSLLIGSIAGEMLHRGAGNIASSVALLAGQWPTYDALNEQLVECTGDNGERLLGRASGIDDRGCLLVNTKGRLNAITAGNISIRRQP